MTENTDTILSALPSRLKEARKTLGLSLDAAAKLSGVSRSMVSQIERGESSPTIATLWNLTRALNVDFAGLMDQGSPKNQIDLLRCNEVPTINNAEKGYRIAILSPPEEAEGHEVYDIHFQPRGILSSQPHTRGTIEQLTVIDGKVRVTSGSASDDLSVGDTARYAADISHEITAEDNSARVFLIVKYQK